MKRNTNVDFLRAVAIIIIIVYHCYILSGTPLIGHVKMHTLLSFGGEVGVTLFFLLSGFGIYCSLNKSGNNDMRWGAFMKKRCVRIMPQYYFCIVMLLIFQSSALISVQGVKDILAYSLFGQNLFVSTHGSINGALWAMATIFQFYLIAIPLYRWVKRNWIVAGIGSIGITIISKYFIYHVILNNMGFGGSAYFVYGRQLISALDNFVLGMITARIVQSTNEKSTIYKKFGVIGIIISLCMLVGISYWLSSNGLYVDSLRGYLGHTILAILLAAIIGCFAVVPSFKGKIVKPFLWIAKYEYGMYLWHMPIIACLYNGSPVFFELASYNFALFAVCMILIIAGIGFFISTAVDSVNYSKIFQKQKANH